MPPKKDKLFSSDQEFLLIHEVEKRPILWDSTTDVYKRADLKPTVWAEIVNVLGNDKFNVDNVSHRWKNMKDTFHSNWNKVVESKKKCSGNGTDDMYVPKWPYYKSLLFLKKSMVTGKSVDNITNVESQASDSTILDSSGSSGTLDSVPINVYYDEHLKQYMLIPNDTATLDESNPSPTVTSTPPSEPSCSLVQPGPSSAPAAVPFSPFQQPLPRRNSAPSGSVVKSTSGSEDELYLKRGSAKRKSGNLMEEAVRAVKELAQQPLPEIQPEDTAQHFGLYIAGRLRGMEQESRKLCEKELMDVLAKY